MPPWILAVLLLTVAGATLVYAGAQHQKLLASPRPALRWRGWLALILALVPMVGWFGPATAVFTWATLLMLVWSVVPLVAAWRRKED